MGHFDTKIFLLMVFIIVNSIVSMNGYHIQNDLKSLKYEVKDNSNTGVRV